MTEILPDPLVAAEVDLRDFAYMQFDVYRLRNSKAWRVCKRDPAMAFYMMNLWLASWHEVPAASLEDDDEALADYAMCDMKKWSKIKATALRGWIKCSDGRLYHSTVAEKALAAWERKIAQRDRTQKAREALAQKRTNSSTERATTPVITPTTDPQTDPPTATVAGSRREGEEKRREEGSASLRSAGAAAPPASEPEKPPDLPTQFWREGLAIVRNLTKRGDIPSRKVLGKMLDAIGGDHAPLLAILRRAEVEQPDGPIDWIRAAINHHSGLLAQLGPPDPWGVNAWAKHQPDMVIAENEAGQPEPTINGWLVITSAEVVAMAIGLPESWRGNWDAMGGWMRKDIAFTDPRVLVAMGDQVRRMGGDIRTMAVFDGMVGMTGMRLGVA